MYGSRTQRSKESDVKNTKVKNTQVKGYKTIVGNLGEGLTQTLITLTLPSPNSISLTLIGCSGRLG